MNIWKFYAAVEYYSDKNVRNGLRLRFDKDVDDEVRRACKEFAKWLRKNYTFPIRIPIYLKSTYYIKAIDGEMVSATFLGPYDRLTEPYIRVATGDYYNMMKKRGKDNALAAILHSIAHELTHYFQWVNDVDYIDEKRIERQASLYATKILNDYRETRDHP